MARPTTALTPEVVQGLLDRLDEGDTSREVLKPLTKHFLSALTAKAPGRSVEVRVPPFAAVQCVEGPRHTRGTPPNVVETDPATWLALALGRDDWDAALAAGRVRISGHQRTYPTIQSDCI